METHRGGSGLKRVQQRLPLEQVEKYVFLHLNYRPGVNAFRWPADLAVPGDLPKGACLQHRPQGLLPQACCFAGR